MTRALAGLAAAAATTVLIGCAAAPVPAPDAEPARFKPLAAYAGDAFVPVNLYLNANEQLDRADARLVEYAADRLRDSGAFVRVDRGVSRWPITLQGRYRRGERTAGSGKRALSVLTLGLVPVWVDQTHTLFIEIFAEPESVAALELSVTVSERESLYDLGGRGATDRAAMDALLDRLAAEIAQRKLVPRWKSFEPEAAPKKKKKVPGRAT